jgi:hypothetical protein
MTPEAPARRRARRRAGTTGLIRAAPLAALARRGRRRLPPVIWHGLSPWAPPCAPPQLTCGSGPWRRAAVPPPAQWRDCRKGWPFGSSPSARPAAAGPTSATAGWCASTMASCSFGWRVPASGWFARPCHERSAWESRHPPAILRPRPLLSLSVGRDRELSAGLAQAQSSNSRSPTNRRSIASASCGGSSMP